MGAAKVGGVSLRVPPSRAILLDSKRFRDFGIAASRVWGASLVSRRLSPLVSRRLSPLVPRRLSSLVVKAHKAAGSESWGEESSDDESMAPERMRFIGYPEGLLRRNHMAVETYMAEIESLEAQTIESEEKISAGRDKVKKISFLMKAEMVIRDKGLMKEESPEELLGEDAVLDDDRLMAILSILDPMTDEELTPSQIQLAFGLLVVIGAATPGGTPMVASCLKKAVETEESKIRSLEIRVEGLKRRINFVKRGVSKLTYFTNVLRKYLKDNPDVFT